MNHKKILEAVIELIKLYGKVMNEGWEGTKFDNSEAIVGLVAMIHTVAERDELIERIDRQDKAIVYTQSKENELRKRLKELENKEPTVMCGDGFSTLYDWLTKVNPTPEECKLLLESTAGINVDPNHDFYLC